MIDLAALLADADAETIVHLEYEAGLPANAQAVAEFRQAADWNARKGTTVYVGHFVSLRKNKWGEDVVTLWVHNRAGTGAYRSFNQRLGNLIAFRVEKR